MNIQELIEALQAIATKCSKHTDLIYETNNGEQYSIVDVSYDENTDTVVFYEP